jgi:predicted ATP-binding protein involved in virulence
MKLRKLRLQNYRIHQDSTLDIGDAKFVCLRGKNMSGKTSFAEALSMNLAVTTVSLPADGKGFKGKIGLSDSKAIITADIQGNHLLRKNVVLNCNTSGRTGEAVCLDEIGEKEKNEVVDKFENFLSDKKESLLISLNTDYFSKLDREKQTNLLAKLVLPSHYNFPQDKIEATNRLLNKPINFDSEPFDVIAKAYDALYQERKTTNRQVEDLVIPDPLPMVKGVDSALLQAELNAVREQRTKLQAERDAAVSKANEVEVKRGRLQTKIDGLQTKVRDDKRRLEAVEAHILPADKLKALEEVASRSDKFTQLNAQHSEFLHALRVTNDQIGRLNSISGKGSTCPACDQPIYGEKIASLVADLRKEYEEMDSKLQGIDTAIEALGDIQGALSSIQKHNSAVKEKSEIEKSLSETVDEGKKTRTQLNALGEREDATLPFNDPLALAETKINNILEKLRPVIAAEERVKEIERLTEQKKKLVAKAASLDTLTKYFDKDGIKAELIGKYIGSFESKINSVLSAWGYKTALTMDPFSFETTTPRGYVGPVKELSGAEEHIFKAAFQCAVSIAAGINFVVIDEIEELGTDIRQALFATVYGLIEEGILEQAILIGFSLDKTLPKPQAPGSKYFYVENGTVEELR